MHKLIEDNVRMGREVQKADERVQEMHTKIELMKLDVEAEKGMKLSLTLIISFFNMTAFALSLEVAYHVK